MDKKNKLFIFIFVSSILLLSCKSSTNLQFPIKNKKYTISSEYGYRNFKYRHFHNGVDIPLVEGTKLYSMSDGIVTYIGYTNGYGNNIVITYSNGYKSMYGHISSNFIVKKGDTVHSGQLVAYVGPKYLSNGKLNGMTTGPHLHFTLYCNNKTIDPLSIKYST